MGEKKSMIHRSATKIIRVKIILDKNNTNEKITGIIYYKPKNYVTKSHNKKITKTKTTLNPTKKPKTKKLESRCYNSIQFPAIWGR